MFNKTYFLPLFNSCLYIFGSIDLTENCLFLSFVAFTPLHIIPFLLFRFPVFVVQFTKLAKLQKTTKTFALNEHLKAFSRKHSCPLRIHFILRKESMVCVLRRTKTFIVLLDMNISTQTSVMNISVSALVQWESLHDFQPPMQFHIPHEETVQSIVTLTSVN